jgi:predicted acyl esterase
VEIIKLMPNIKIMVMLIFLSYTHEFVMVPMRDGVRLATDVYKPTFYTGRLHTILVRTPSLYRASGGFRVAKGNLRCLGRMDGEP